MAAKTKKKRRRLLCKIKHDDRAAFYIYRDGTWRCNSWGITEDSAKWDIAVGVHTGIKVFIYKLSDDDDWQTDDDSVINNILINRIENAIADLEIEKMLK